MIIYGASDDLIEIEDCSRPDEIGGGGRTPDILRVGTAECGLMVKISWNDDAPDDSPPWEITVTGVIGDGFPYTFSLAPGLENADPEERDPMIVIECPHDTPWVLWSPIPDDLLDAWREFESMLRQYGYTAESWAERIRTRKEGAK